MDHDVGFSCPNLNFLFKPVSLARLGFLGRAFEISFFATVRVSCVLSWSEWWHLVATKKINARNLGCQETRVTKADALRRAKSHTVACQSRTVQQQCVTAHSEAIARVNWPGDLSPSSMVTRRRQVINERFWSPAHHPPRPPVSLTSNGKVKNCTAIPFYSTEIVAWPDVFFLKYVCLFFFEQ